MPFGWIASARRIRAAQEAVPPPCTERLLKHPETEYLSDFAPRCRNPDWSGYKVTLALHQHAKHPLFSRARDAAEAYFYEDIIAEVVSLEAHLKSTDRTL